MIYLYWYLGVGVCIVLPFVVRSRILKKDDLPTANDLLEALQPERKSLWYRLRSNVLAPLLTGLLVVPFWPFVVYLKVQDMVLGKHEASNLEEPKFAVVRADLLERVSIAEIEQCERVFDPLSAVPDLPFGHLNTAWKQFCEGMERGTVERLRQGSRQCHRPVLPDHTEGCRRGRCRSNWHITHWHSRLAATSSGLKGAR